MTSGQDRFPIAPSKWEFKQAGQSGMWMNTELLPLIIRFNDALNARDVDAMIRDLVEAAVAMAPALTPHGLCWASRSTPTIT